MTHEDFIKAIRDIVAPRVNDVAKRARLLDAKLVYGRGMPGTRGVTYYQGWQNGDRHDFIEVCAGGEESTVQVAGTTIHELGHCLAGWDAGHGSDWKLACGKLGLVKADAAGQAYQTADFAPEVWSAIDALGVPADGTPAFQVTPQGPVVNPFVGGLPRFTGPRPCPLGVGTRGGRSRGVGSGSRQRLYHCQCVPPIKVRHGGDNLAAHCDHCHSAFTRVDAVSVPKVDTGESPATNLAPPATAEGK